ncbi:Hypothetical predicted protein [Podarcis lilfordi]|uniref:Secreted protein n=1 Tax=Podarcis lilfordi TaxID=74358 RepID=A0AA35KTZ8_9SAUR|nr:Hypothetical predicted protein [Podarcis lilfordi]
MPATRWRRLLLLLKSFAFLGSRPLSAFVQPQPPPHLVACRLPEMACESISRRVVVMAAFRETFPVTGYCSYYRRRRRRRREQLLSSPAAAASMLHSPSAGGAKGKS